MCPPQRAYAFNISLMLFTCVKQLYTLLSLIHPLKRSVITDLTIHLGKVNRAFNLHLALKIRLNEYRSNTKSNKTFMSGKHVYKIFLRFQATTNKIWCHWSYNSHIVHVTRSYYYYVYLNFVIAQIAGLLASTLFTITRW